MRVRKEKEQDREKASSTGALECFPMSGGEDGAGGEGGGCCFVAWPFEEYVVRDPMNECTINASPHLLNYSTILQPLKRPGPRLPPPEHHRLSLDVISLVPYMHHLIAAAIAGCTQTIARQAIHRPRA